MNENTVVRKAIWEYKSQQEKTKQKLPSVLLIVVLVIAAAVFICAGFYLDALFNKS